MSIYPGDWWITLALISMAGLLFWLAALWARREW